MNRITRRRAPGAVAVKRAISLPSDIDGKIATLSRKEGMSYSSVVQQAVWYFLKRREDLEMEKAYRDYYASPARRKESEQLSAEMMAVTQWPHQEEAQAHGGQKRRSRLA